jgi:glycosyltransferase involved in cell wall biosynthesis
MMYIRRLVARRVNVNIQPSEFILARQRQPHSILVPHAIDSGVFRPAVSRHVTDTVFLYCGRLIEEKGVQVLIRALKLARQRGGDLRLRVRGEGPYYGRLLELTTALGLAEAVTFESFARGQDLVDELRAAYALVVPSLWDEVTGIVAMEAMACGTPVIATNVGGLAELAIEGGLVVERCDAEALAEALVTLYEARAMRDQLARRGARAMVTDYSLNSVGAKHLAILRSATSRVSAPETAED